MDAEQSNIRREMLWEYLLYTGIIAITAAAVPFRQNISVYVGCAYVAFLGWAFNKLNGIHRKRKSRPKPEVVPRPEKFAKPVRRPMLGLTAPQLALVVVVFVGASVTFTWAFTNLR